MHPVELVVFVGSLLVWLMVLGKAMALFNGDAPYRGAWNGMLYLALPGFTVAFNLEGWADYDYYYNTWGHQLLSGYLPYTAEFEHPTTHGTEYYAPYYFPPLFVYLCGLGQLLPFGPFGIAILLTAFGYMTALPLYGIARELSGSEMVGLCVAATYLFNPLVLFYTAFQWLNPAPFVFFSTLSFYLVVKGRTASAVVSMVFGVFFKQICLFLSLPLIAYVLKKSYLSSKRTPDRHGTIVISTLKGLVRHAMVAVLTAIALSLPYVYDLPHYFYSLFQRLSPLHLNSLSSPPPYDHPLTVVVPFITVGAPLWLNQLLNALSETSAGLVGGSVLFFTLMLSETPDQNADHGYWRTVLYLTLLLFLWVHLFAPRGVYKYYFVGIMPLVSLLSAPSMCKRGSISIRPSPAMVLGPVTLSLLILLPDRNIYLAFVVVILLLFAAGPRVEHLFDFGPASSQSNLLSSRGTGIRPKSDSSPSPPSSSQWSLSGWPSSHRAS
ncbi:MAG: hypothetical protein HXY34_03085 [Candidatus Thorarchaeota archaeon]|nr:hypothetical protein [Candidatus Thorarchaeota archaeon]